MLADEKTRMQSLGEIDILVIVDNTIVLRLRALVVKQLHVQCYAGTTFHVDNEVEAKLTTGEIEFHGGKFKIKQHNTPALGGPVAHPPPAITLDELARHNSVISDKSANVSSISPLTLEDLASQIQLLRSEMKGTDQAGPKIEKLMTKSMSSVPTHSSTIHINNKKGVLPMDVYQIKLNSVDIDQEFVTVIPQFNKPDDPGPEWLPQICKVQDGHALYQNNHDQSLLHTKGVHFHTVSAVEMSKKDLNKPIVKRTPGPNLAKPCDIIERLKEVKVNNKIMTDVQKKRLAEIHQRNHRVFDDDLSTGFIGHEAKINFRQENQAPPYKLWAPQFNKKCQDLLQSKCDQLEHEGVLADPIDHGINVRNVSPCFIQQKARAKHKKLEDCALEEIRFISCFNVLNDSIRAIPSTTNTYDNIGKFLSRHKFFIFADLLNSYFQIKVDSQDWKHLGVMTPHRGLKVMTRLGQGLLNSDVVLDQVLGKVLGDEMSAGFCLAARDDLFVAGDSINEALENWNVVLTKLEEANLKVTARKVRVFLEDTEVFGHRIRNGEVSPSDHTVATLGDISMEEIKTNKQLNSWRGLYKTLIRHLPDLASMMAPFDKATATKPAAEKFDWTIEGRVTAFNRAKQQLKKINTLTLPRPEEKLILMPDTACEDNCTGWVLYTLRNGKNLPVQFCSAKLSDYMQCWHPCEKEGIGAVLSIDQCRHWINESLHKTTVLADNKPVVEAANMMRLGRSSKSPRLQSLLASVNRSNIQFMHSSAKAGDHVVPDRLSRMKRTCGAKDCQVERFLDDVPAQIQCMSVSLKDLDLERFIFADIEPAVLSATSAELADILCKGRGTIPLGSRAAWLEIQRSNAECRKYLDQVKYGQLPGKKDTAKVNLNKMRKNCIVEQGLIVCKSFDNMLMKERSRVFVPGEFLKSILTVIHVRLDHITPFQLENVFNRYFYGISTNSICAEISAECGFCISLDKFPKQLQQFDPKLEPKHPGSHFNADVMRRAAQKILINVDLFSGYMTACILKDEQRDEMIRGLILLTTPIRHSPEIIIRVDSAPALKALEKTGHKDLTENGIKLVKGDDFNKNSNCNVDRKMEELQSVIKRLCPTETKISLSTLSKAVTNLNSSIRNQGLTASQILFSRDTVIGENLDLDDKRLMADKLEKRQINHSQSAKCKAPNGKTMTRQNFKPGDMAYVKHQGSKHESRNPFLVTGTDENKVKLQKILHSHHTSSKGPAVSSEIKTVDSKFLFKQDHPARRVKTTLPHILPERKTETYIIPQRRKITIPDRTWIPRQSAECATDDDEVDDEETNHEVEDSMESASAQDISEGDYDDSSGREASDENSTTSNEQLEDRDDRTSVRDLDNRVNEEEAAGSQDEAGAIVGDNRIRVFEDGHGVYSSEQLCQHKIPRKRDRIAFFDQESGRWKTATLTTNALRGYDSYYNCVYDDGTEDGIHLYRDERSERWTFIDDSCCIQCDGTDPMGPGPAVIGQVDGVCIPASLTPTPETTPEKVGPVDSIRFGNDDYVQSSSEEESPIPTLDKSFTGSPEWDSYGTHLERPLLYDQPLTQITHLDRRTNLSLVLPLTSTPNPSRRPRVSGCRKPLPLEVDRDDDDAPDSKPKFLAKLNPFRKRDR